MKTIVCFFFSDLLIFFRCQTRTWCGKHRIFGTPPYRNLGFGAGVDCTVHNLLCYQTHTCTFIHFILTPLFSPFFNCIILSSQLSLSPPQHTPSTQMNSTVKINELLILYYWPVIVSSSPYWPHERFQILAMMCTLFLCRFSLLKPLLSYSTSSSGFSRQILKHNCSPLLFLAYRM